MPAPRIVSNSPELQSVFDAYSDYLDRLEVAGIGGVTGSIAPGRDISVTSDGVGGVTIGSTLEVIEDYDKWQLLVQGTNMYMVPGLVHFSEAGEAALTSEIPYWENTTSLADTARPYWTLPLTKNALYQVYLVVDTAHTPSKSNVWLIEDGVDDIMDEAEESSIIILLHEFTSTDDEIYNYGGDTSDGGYPGLTETSQRCRSDIVIGGLTDTLLHRWRPYRRDKTNSPLEVSYTAGTWYHYSMSGILADAISAITHIIVGTGTPYVVGTLDRSSGVLTLAAAAAIPLDADKRLISTISFNGGGTAITTIERHQLSDIFETAAMAASSIALKFFDPSFGAYGGYRDTIPEITSAQFAKGNFWYLRQALVAAASTELRMHQTCLPWEDTADNSTAASGTVVGLAGGGIGGGGGSGGPSGPNVSELTITDGLLYIDVLGTPTLYQQDWGVTNASTGAALLLDFTDGLETTGFRGNFTVIDPTTGAGIIYSINDNGEISQ